jgi:hypothetical protein
MRVAISPPPGIRARFGSGTQPSDWGRTRPSASREKRMGRSSLECYSDYAHWFRGTNGGTKRTHTQEDFRRAMDFTNGQVRAFLKQEEDKEK